MDFKRFLSRSLFLAITAFTAINPLVKPYPQPKLFTTSHSQKLYDYRARIHHDALAVIKKEFNIDDARWRFYMDYVHALVTKDDLFSGNGKSKDLIHDSEHWLIKEAKKILIECNVNLNRIEITFDYDSKVNGAAAQYFDKHANCIKHRLILNPDWFFMHSYAEREAILRHEIMHFANYDGLEEAYIFGLLMELGYTQKELDDNAAIINYRQQRELRADLLAVVEKPILIPTEHNRFAHYAKYTNALSSIFWKTHPTDKTRAESMAQLLAYLKRPLTLA